MLACLCACGGEKGNHVINFQGESVPQNVDPLLASAQSEKMVMENIYQSLFTLDEKGNVVGGCAFSHEFLDNGTRCRVTVRSNLKWSDGQPVTPKDFVFGLQRAVSPETKAACAAQLTCIAGAQEILQGKKSADTLGVTVLGENTLEFSLVGKGEAFIAAMAGPGGIPCNRTFFENCKGRYGTGREYVLSNGLFQIKGWSKEEPDVFLRLIRNENHPDAQTVRPSGIYFTFGTGEQGYSLMEEKKVDGTLIQGQQVESAQKAGYTLLSQNTKTYGLILNTKGRQEMKNSSLRKALAGAVELSQLAAYLPNSVVLAQGVVMPGSFYATNPYPQTNPYLTQLKARAKENFQIAVKELGADALSDFELWYVATSGNRPAVDYMVQCWQKEFGLYVTVKEVSQSELWYGLENGYCHMGIGALSAFGGNSLEMLREFAFAGEKTKNGYTDKEYDKLLETAEKSGEIAHQQQCEARLLNEGYLLPLYVTKEFYAFRPQILDVTLDGFTGVLQMEKAGKTDG